jgi:integrase
MPHFPKPYFRRSRRQFYVQIDGHEITLGADRDAAFAKYHELMRQRQPREARSCPRATIVVVLTDEFLDWCQKNRAPRSYDWYKERIQSFINSIPAQLTVAELRPYHVQRWIDATTWSDGMKRGAVTAVQRALNWAVEMGHIDRSPLAHFKKPPAGKREIIITPAEYNDLLTRFDQRFQELLKLAWETGARPQELLALEARHLDREERRLLFPRTEAKGKKQIRVVYLNDVAFALVGRLAAEYPDGKLLRNGDGRPWHRNAVSCRFQRIKKKIGHKLCLYNFRHSFCHRALKNGVDPITIANLMGHVDTAMIARVYSNLSQDPVYLRKSLQRATA